MNGRSKRAAGLLVAALTLAGCGGEQRDAAPAGSAGGSGDAATADAPAAAPAAGGGDAAAVEEAEEIFALRCTTCHGENGAGDGPASKGLSPPPRNFQDPAWQDEVSDEHIANIIQYGGAAVGRSPTMPGNPDLTGKPDVVAALVAHVRGLRSP